MEKKTSVQEKLAKVTLEELENIKDPLYFYNTYVLPDNGTPITREQFNDIIAERLSIKNRKGDYIRNYPLTEKAVFKLEENTRDISTGIDFKSIDFEVPKYII